MSYIYEKFEEWNPTEDSETKVAHAKNIIDEYSDQGYILTLRQLYYQFVARDLISNTLRSYKNLGVAMTKARMSGRIAWNAIEDRAREFKCPYIQEDHMQLLRKLPHYINFDKWKDQKHYIEVWVEKEALGNVIERACFPFDVPFMSCKGYLSASEAWAAGVRFRKKVMQGKQCHIFHLGDHDPSGIDMTRDNRDRVNLFCDLNNLKGYEDLVEVHRLALNMDQVDEYNPPENPTKITDSRAGPYIERYGNSSWELDALEPSVIEELIQDHISSYIDQDVLDSVRDKEKEIVHILYKIAPNWDKIKDILK